MGFFVTKTGSPRLSGKDQDKADRQQTRRNRREVQEQQRREYRDIRKAVPLRHR